jgi:hypothetical protein
MNEQSANVQTARSESMTRRLSNLVALALVFIASFEAWGQANFVEPGSFIVLKPCQAFTSFKKKTGAVNLEVDKIYVARGENKTTDASHVHIDVDGARKWVSLECGDYEGQKPPFAAQPASGGDRVCHPFFDDLDNPVDVRVGGNVVLPLVPLKSNPSVRPSTRFAAVLER